MSINTSTLGINYASTTGNFASKQAKWKKLAAQSANSNSSKANSSVYTTSTISGIEDNKCTDGKDDGKISFFSKVANVVEGSAKGVLNMAKSAIQHPFKTAAMVGVCCIPIVGPIVGGGLAAYGLYSGGKQVLNAINVANNATTDAEAKAAFENIGSGAVTVGVSAVGLKASAGVLKGQLNGGSSTVNAVKDVVSNKATAGEVAKTAVTEGIKETATNVGNLVQGVVKKGQKALEKGKEYAKEAQEGNLGNKLKQDVSEFAENAGNKVQEKVNGAKKKVDEFNANRKPETKAQAKEAKAKAQAEVQTKVENMMNEAKNSGAKVTAGKNGSFEIKRTDGTVEAYNNQGVIQTKTYKNGTVDTYKNGQLTQTKTTTETGSKTTKYDADGNQISKKFTEKTSDTTSKTQSTSKIDDKTFSSASKTVDGKVTQTSKGVTSADGKFTGVKTNGKDTVWFENGTKVENPSALTQARIRYEASKSGVYIDKAIGDGSTTIFGHTIDSKYAQYFGALTSQQNQ